MKRNYEFSIVIPCYNEISGLPSLIERYKVAKNGFDFQLVLVDNGSNDGTLELLNNLIKKAGNNFIKVIRIEENIGYGNGINTGLKNCDAGIVGWSHGDLQCNPEDVFRGYEIYIQQQDKKTLIKGKRLGRDRKSLILSYCLDIYSTLLLFRVYHDINGQPKIFPKELLTSFKDPPKEFSYDLYVQDKALRLGYKVKGFKVNFEKRPYGLSKWAYSTVAKVNTIKGFLIDIIKIRLGVMA